MTWFLLQDDALHYFSVDIASVALAAVRPLRFNSRLNMLSELHVAGEPLNGEVVTAAAAAAGADAPTQQPADLPGALPPQFQQTRGDPAADAGNPQFSS